MDRRTLLAIGLVMLVIIVPAILFPPRPPAPPAEGTTDSAVGGPAPPGATDTGAPAPASPVPVAEAAPPAPPARPAPARFAADTVPERQVVVESRLYRFVFSTRGARLVRAELREYGTLAVGDSGAAQIVPEGSEFLAYAVVIGRDTIPLAQWTFEPSATRVVVGAEGAEVEWEARRGPMVVRLAYTFEEDDYLFSARGQFTGVGQETGLMLVGLGPGLRSVEADTALDFSSLGVVTKATKTENLAFSSLDPGERRILAGPFEWVAVKSKYFVGAVFAIDEGQPRLGGAVAVGGRSEGKFATRTHVTASLPAPGGRFGHSVYVGPQEYRRLARIGHDFEDVNPYGWIFRPIIRPFAIAIVQVLLWMHETLNLAYGWVLILFGIAVRIVLWPLNQKAMRSSTAMQAIQPEMKALQERYKEDPPKLQQEMMKLYKHHGVNPLGGCVPMLIPMPVLFALFFVFANTIEFRGVPFLWLPDLSAHDPLYIIPLVMGLSMFGVSKIGMLGVPPNPQAKMMLYVMPVMFTVLFLKFSSGLNLYYAVSNLASIPQQWLIAKERMAKVLPKRADS